MQTTTYTTSGSTGENATSAEDSGENLYVLAERRLRELIAAGNIEAIKLGLTMGSPPVLVHV